MRIRETFPPNPAFGHCLVNGQISQGPCVDLQISTDLFTRNRRPESLVLSAQTVCSMAGHFGMVDPEVHAKAREALVTLKTELDQANERIDALLTTLRVFGLPEPAPEPKKAAPKKAAPKKEPASGPVP
jgi:hypothetical protein